MLDMNGKDNRVNRQTIPSIPPGYLLASVTYDTDHTAVFLAYQVEQRMWVVGIWDAAKDSMFYKSGSQFKDSRVYPATPEGFGDACMDFVTRSNPLLKTYTQEKNDA